jgi:LysM repeat protein
MLIRKIEEYGLNNYDRGISTSGGPDNKIGKIEEKRSNLSADSTEAIVGNVSGNYSVNALRSRVLVKNRIQYIIAKEGDTHENLEKEFQLLKWELGRYNELPAGFNISPGQILYLQPKREKADVGSEIHTVTEGETMYLISQKYGVKLKNLLTMNRMTEGQEPVAGMKIWLRAVKPVD